MGRYYSEYTNRRGKTYGAQILAGDGVHTRGWDAGARVTCRPAGPDGTADEFDVYMTWGSHDSGIAVHVGTVRDTVDGPMWVQAVVPAAHRRRRAAARAIRAVFPPRIRGRRGPDYSDAHYAERRAESRAAYAETELNRERHADPETAQAIEAAARNGQPGDILSRIDSALAGPALDYSVFGPESNLAGEN